MPTSGFQDYSALVDPRTLPSEIDSILEAEKTDTLDLNLEIPLPEDSRSRSLKTDIEAIISGSGDEENKEKLEEKKKYHNRECRDNQPGSPWMK